MDITSPFATIYTEVWERQIDEQFLLREQHANDETYED